MSISGVITTKTSSATAASSCGSSDQRSTSGAAWPSSCGSGRHSFAACSSAGQAEPPSAAGRKKAGRSFAGPAHEPGGGGGDPQAHLQILVAARRRLTVQNLLSVLDVPAADPMPPFYVCKIGFS